MWITKDNKKSDAKDKNAKWREDPRPCNGVCPCGRPTNLSDAWAIQNDVGHKTVIEYFCPDCYTTWELRSEEKDVKDVSRNST